MPNIVTPGLHMPGQQKYRVHIYAMVRIDSNPVSARNPIQALQAVCAAGNLEMQLRNVHGNVVLDGVEYEGRLLKAFVDNVDDEGQCTTLAAKLTEEDLEKMELSHDQTR